MNSKREFSELRDLWVSRQIISPDAGEGTKMIKKLKALQKFQNRINNFKLFAISLIFVLTGAVFFVFKISSAFAYAGFGITIICSLLFFSYYLKNQLDVSKLQLDAPTVVFLQSAIGRLQKQNEVFNKPFLYFSLGMLAGMNILFFGLMQGEDVSGRLQIHVAFSLWIVLTYFAGKRFRQKRIRKEVLPLIEELKKEKEQLEGNV